MDVDCWHCFESLDKHFVKGSKLLCNKINPKTNECEEYKATQDILDDEDLYSEVIIGDGLEAKNYALLPVGESMIVDFRDVKYKITKNSSSSSTSEPLTDTITDKIVKSKTKAIDIKNQTN